MLAGVEHPQAGFAPFAAVVRGAVHGAEDSADAGVAPVRGPRAVRGLNARGDGSTPSGPGTLLVSRAATVPPLEQT
jgi:hypothetical protein